MDEGRNMILLFPTLINFKSEEDRKYFEPSYDIPGHDSQIDGFVLIHHFRSCHMFYPRRVLDINDGKPKWTGINGTSELIADSPKEAVKKRKIEETEEKEQREQKNGD